MHIVVGVVLLEAHRGVLLLDEHLHLVDLAVLLPLTLIAHPHLERRHHVLLRRAVGQVLCKNATRQAHGEIVTFPQRVARSARVGLY